MNGLKRFGRGAVALGAVLALTLSACGGSSSSDSTTAPKVKNAALARPTCDTAAPCKLGGEGKGGGTIFYYSATGFPCRSFSSTTCNMLEYAPNGWSAQGGTTRGCDGPNLNADIKCIWNNVPTAPTSGFAYNIGAGMLNTTIIRGYTGGATTTQAFVGASDTARQYTGSNMRSTYYLQDWFLPNFAEMTQLCKWANGNSLSAAMCSAGTLKTGFSAGNYWTSDGPTSSTGQAIALNMANGARVGADRSVRNHIRPIRAFLGVIDQTSIPITTPAPTTTTTSTTTFPATTTTLSCANGGNCAVGNIGPGGGKIFYVSATGFKCGVTLQSTCRYLEAAPDNATPDNGTLPTGGAALSNDMGAGAKNTAALAALNTSNLATGIQAYRGGGKSDWFIGSKAEMNEWCKSIRLGTSARGAGDPSVECVPGMVRQPLNQNYGYWSSSAQSATNAFAFFLSKSPIWGEINRSVSLKVRAIRAF